MRKYRLFIAVTLMSVITLVGCCPTSAGLGLVALALLRSQTGAGQ